MEDEGIVLVSAPLRVWDGAPPRGGAQEEGAGGLGCLRCSQEHPWCPCAGLELRDLGVKGKLAREMASRGEQSTP